MFSNKMSRRSLVATAAATPFVAPHASSAQAENAHSFWSGGLEAIRLANLSLWSPGGGAYVAMLTIVPTQEEIDRILAGTGEDEASHVDFVFDFVGLEPAGLRSDFVLGASDYVRYAGAEVVQGEHPVFIARCFNIASRWEAGRPITVVATISGYRWSGQDRPWASVQMVPCAYWHVDQSAQYVYHRTTDDITTYYARVAVGEPSQLLDTTGHSGFFFP